MVESTGARAYADGVTPRQESAWRRLQRATRELADADQELERELAAVERERATDRPRLRLIDGGRESAQSAA